MKMKLDNVDIGLLCNAEIRFEPKKEYGDGETFDLLDKIQESKYPIDSSKRRGIGMLEKKNDRRS